jgi:hypothetical protein
VCYPPGRMLVVPLPALQGEVCHVRGIVVIPLPALGGGVPRGIVERGVPLYSAGWDREVRVALSAVAVADCDLVLLEIRSAVL